MKEEKQSILGVKNLVCKYSLNLIKHTIATTNKTALVSIVMISTVVSHEQYDVICFSFLVH